MDVFSCIVKLRSGSESGMFTGEVPKENVSAAEVLLLKTIHGEDAVTGIQKTGKDNRNNAAERDRLASIYRLEVVNRIFGAESWKKLPTKLPSARDEDPTEMAA